MNDFQESAGKHVQLLFVSINGIKINEKKKRQKCIVKLVEISVRVCVLNLFVVCGRLQGAVVVVVQLGTGVIWHLLQAVDAAALTAGAHRGAGDGMITAQTVHLTACLISILRRGQINTHRETSQSFLKKQYLFQLLRAIYTNHCKVCNSYFLNRSLSA